MTGYKKISTKTKRRNKRDSANICMSQFWCTVANKPQKAVTCMRCMVPSFSIFPLFLISLQISKTLQRLSSHIKLQSASNGSTNSPAKTFCSMKDKLYDSPHYYFCKKLLCKYTGFSKLK